MCSRFTHDDGAGHERDDVRAWRERALLRVDVRTLRRDGLHADPSAALRDDNGRKVSSNQQHCRDDSEANGETETQPSCSMTDGAELEDEKRRRTAVQRSRPAKCSGAGTDT